MIFNLLAPLVHAPQLERSKVYVPESVADLLEADVFARQRVRHADPVLLPPDAAVATDETDFEVAWVFWASELDLAFLADALADLRSRVGAPTTLGIGLPVPNEFFSTRLTLDGMDSDELLPQLALFIHHLPALSRFVSEQGLADGQVATNVFLRLRDDGARLVSWHDRRSLDLQEHVLEVDDAV